MLVDAEEHLALHMWDEAAAALDSLPDDVKDMPQVAIVRLDLCIGQQLWDRGLMLGLGLLETNPNDAELWLRIARLMAGANNRDGAARAASRCAELNPEFRCFLSRDKTLAPMLMHAVSAPGHGMRRAA